MIITQSGGESFGVSLLGSVGSSGGSSVLVSFDLVPGAARSVVCSDWRGALAVGSWVSELGMVPCFGVLESASVNPGRIARPASVGVFADLHSWLESGQFDSSDLAGIEARLGARSVRGLWREAGARSVEELDIWRVGLASGGAGLAVYVPGASGGCWLVAADGGGAVAAVDASVLDFQDMERKRVSLGVVCRDLFPAGHVSEDDRPARGYRPVSWSNGDCKRLSSYGFSAAAVTHRRRGFVKAAWSVPGRGVVVSSAANQAVRRQGLGFLLAFGALQYLVLRGFYFVVLRFVIRTLRYLLSRFAGVYLSRAGRVFPAIASASSVECYAALSAVEWSAALARSAFGSWEHGTFSASYGLHTGRVAGGAWGVESGSRTETFKTLSRRWQFAGSAYRHFDGEKFSASETSWQDLADFKKSALLCASGVPGVVAWPVSWESETYLDGDVSRTRCKVVPGESDTSGAVSVEWVRGKAAVIEGARILRSEAQPVRLSDLASADRVSLIVNQSRHSSDLTALNLAVVATGKDARSDVERFRLYLRQRGISCGAVETLRGVEYWHAQGDGGAWASKASDSPRDVVTGYVFWVASDFWTLGRVGLLPYLGKVSKGAARFWSAVSAALESCGVSASLLTERGRSTLCAASLRHAKPLSENRTMAKNPWLRSPAAWGNSQGQAFGALKKEYLARRASVAKIVKAIEVQSKKLHVSAAKSGLAVSAPRRARQAASVAKTARANLHPVYAAALEGAGDATERDRIRKRWARVGAAVGAFESQFLAWFDSGALEAMNLAQVAAFESEMDCRSLSRALEAQFAASK